MKKSFANPFEQQAPELQRLQTQYNTCRINLLAVIVFTLINIALLFTEGMSYFLFSAFVPYLIAFMGLEACGMLPNWYYGEMYGETLYQVEFYDTPVLIGFLAVAVAILGVYFLCWLMSKKHGVVWLIVALVLFSVDTVFLLVMYGSSILDSILDVLFHAWVIYYLVIGIRAHIRMKRLAEEAPLAADFENAAVQDAAVDTETERIEPKPTETEAAETDEPTAEPVSPVAEDNGDENA